MYGQGYGQAPPQWGGAMPGGYGGGQPMGGAPGYYPQAQPQYTPAQGYPKVGGQAYGGVLAAAPRGPVVHDDWLKGTEKAIRKDFDPITRTWKRKGIVLRLQQKPFAQGSMRHAIHMEDLTLGEDEGKGFVAKMSINPIENKKIYFDDVEMQMEAKMWADKFNDKFGKKVVDFIVAYVAELVERPNSPLIGVEKLVSGNYVKYNNNWDWSDDRRNTPQAFSHFTWEESKHKLLVCDLQGVGDLWTDPQIHSSDGKGYGKGNMGPKGIHAFLQNHRCNAICTALKLPVVGKTPKPDNSGTLLQPAKFKPEATLAQCKAQYMLQGMQAAKLPKKKKGDGDQDPDRMIAQVMNAHGLGNDKRGEPPDSFVVLMCGEQSTETRVVYGTCNPLWNERIQMVLPTDGSVDSMVAVVFNTNSQFDDDEPTPLGVVRIPFSTLKDAEGYDDREWPLQEYTMGVIHPDVGDTPPVGTLHLKIHRFHRSLGASFPKPNRPAPPPPGTNGTPDRKPDGKVGEAWRLKEKQRQEQYAQQQRAKQELSPPAVSQPPPHVMSPREGDGSELGHKLKITVRAAQKLRVPRGGDVNSYAVVRVGKNEARTHVVKENPAPMWGQKMLFPPLQAGALAEVFVVNEGSGGALLGSTKILLSTLKFVDLKCSGWFKLESPPDTLNNGSPPSAGDNGHILMDFLLIPEPKDNITC